MRKEYAEVYKDIQDIIDEGRDKGLVLSREEAIKVIQIAKLNSIIEELDSISLISDGVEIKENTEAMLDGFDVLTSRLEGISKTIFGAAEYLCNR